jgi:hypothetical protein
VTTRDGGGLTWTEVQVPHHARRSFDWASCICGWSSGGEDYDALDIEVLAHNREHDGELLAVWEVGSK